MNTFPHNKGKKGNRSDYELVMADIKDDKDDDLLQVFAVSTAAYSQAADEHDDPEEDFDDGYDDPFEEDFEDIYDGEDEESLRIMIRPQKLRQSRKGARRGMMT
jgi:hypothetical protein